MRAGRSRCRCQDINAGLADEPQLFQVPFVVGGAMQALRYGVRTDLERLNTQRFAGGAVHLRYRPKPR